MRNPFHRTQGRHHLTPGRHTVEDLIIDAARNHPYPWLGVALELPIVVPTKHRDGIPVAATIANARARDSQPWTISRLAELSDFAAKAGDRPYRYGGFGGTCPERSPEGMQCVLTENHDCMHEAGAEHQHAAWGRMSDAERAMAQVWEQRKGQDDNPHLPKPWVLPEFQWPGRLDCAVDPVWAKRPPIADTMRDVLAAADLTLDLGVPVDTNPDRLYQPTTEWDCTVGPDPHDLDTDRYRWGHE